MALKKTEIKHNDNLMEFYNLEECLDFFEEQKDIAKKHYALEKMVEFSEGSKELLKIMINNESDKNLISFISSLLAKVDPKIAPIEELLEAMKIENAYLRNHVISILQDYGKEIKYYIVKYLIGDDRDLRIFAINVLGDVKFPESREMMLELLQKEDDVNVAMTAVDYLQEIGQIEDIPIIEKLKSKFKNEPYVEFAVNNAIKMIKA
ncbi:MAG: HEAT repeat domain-containing protein [Campylobacterales bacterium]|nr:HEAT repeat domain-containing protein [Campylobacterales bacterium]